MTQASAGVQIDKEKVSVTEWKFAPGAETGWHRHQHDYVVVPETTGRLLLKTKGGDSVRELNAGKWRAASCVGVRAHACASMCR